MKYPILFLLLFFIQTGFAQVGIGTTTPTPGYELDIAGSLLIQDELKVDALPTGTTEQGTFKFVLRHLNSVPEGEVVKLDLDEVAIAPVNYINYTFHNLSLDNLENVDLQFDAAKYVVGISNIRYEGQTIQKGVSGSDYLYIGNFLWRTFVNNGTWHLEIRNRTRNAVNNNAITYHATLLVYDRKYFKELSPISVNMNGSEFGETAKPNGL